MSHVRRVLVLCTGNSARSQMAEGLIRSEGGARFEVESAGTRPVGVNPLAVKVMREIGVDLSDHRSKSVDEFIGRDFDYVITVCDSAAEHCPIFPCSARRMHWPFVDPAAANGSHDQRIAAFRRVRDHMRERFSAFVADPDAIAR